MCTDAPRPYLVGGVVYLTCHTCGATYKPKES